MIGKVSCAVPDCTLEFQQDVNTQSAAYAIGQTKTFAVENYGWSWVYPELGNTNTDILCPAHKGWKPETEKPTTTITCECGAVFSHEDCSDESASESSHKAMLGAYDAGWHYVDPKRSNLMICPACAAKDKPKPAGHARIELNDERSLGQRAGELLVDELRRRLVHLDLEMAFARARYEQVCTSVGLPRDADSTALFLRLRELVAKEGKQ